MDLSTVEPSVAGPKRPQDRITLKNLPEEWNEILSRPTSERGYQLTDIEKTKKSPIADSSSSLQQGSVVMAAITSCTNTSNPSVMIAAGVVATYSIVCKGFFI